VAHAFAREGVKSTLLERKPVPGGRILSQVMNGVLYELYGLAHLPHEDREVWKLANSLTPFRLYRHRVDIIVEGKRLNWPRCSPTPSGSR
jgi:UDP-galactopyranose mutase